MLSNMVFPNLFLEVIYGIGIFGLLIGFVIFAMRLLKKDPLYEAFLAWPVRLIIYSIGYSVFPPIAFGVAAWMFRKGSSPSKRFALGSLLAGSAWTCFVLPFTFGAGIK